MAAIEIQKGRMMSCYNLSNPNYSATDLIYLFNSIPKPEREKGYWVLHDDALLKIQNLLNGNGERIWRDDRSQNGQFLTRPILIDNSATYDVNFCTLPLLEHTSRHVYLYGALVELINDFPGTNNDSIQQLINWASKQCDVPEKSEMNVHPVHYRDV